MAVKEGHVNIPDVKQINAVESGAQRKFSSSNPPAYCPTDSAVITNQIKKNQRSVQFKIVKVLLGFPSMEYII